MEATQDVHRQTDVHREVEVLMGKKKIVRTPNRGLAADAGVVIVQRGADVAWHLPFIT